MTIEVFSCIQVIQGNWEGLVVFALDVSLYFKYVLNKAYQKTSILRSLYKNMRERFGVIVGGIGQGI